MNKTVKETVPTYDKIFDTKYCISVIKLSKYIFGFWKVVPLSHNRIILDLLLSYSKEYETISFPLTVTSKTSCETPRISNKNISRQNTNLQYIKYQKDDSDVSILQFSMSSFSWMQYSLKAVRGRYRLHTRQGRFKNYRDFKIFTNKLLLELGTQSPMPGLQSKIWSKKDEC